MAKAVNVTATGDVGRKGAKKLCGFYVNSTTGGTLVINDEGRALSGTITPAIGYHPFPADIRERLNVTIANALNVTLFVED